MNHMEEVRKLRAIVEPHYNCAQSLLFRSLTLPASQKKRQWIWGSCSAAECITAQSAEH